LPAVVIEVLPLVLLLLPPMIKVPLLPLPLLPPSSGSAPGSPVATAHASGATAPTNKLIRKADRKDIETSSQSRSSPPAPVAAPAPFWPGV
jgi:hypothetical protein